MGRPISIVVPVLDEADNIDPVVDELFAVLTAAGLAPEAIFIDDGSTDATPWRLAAAKTRHPGLRVLRHQYRAGKSQALRTAIAVARHDWVVTLDGDGQNDPADIPRLLDQAQTDATIALVAGIRRRRDDTIWRRLASRIGNGIRRALLRDGCPDTACGLKLIRRDVFLALPQFDGLHRFLPALVAAAGHRVAMVSVNDRARHSGKSKYTNLGRAMVGIADLLGVAWLRRRHRLPGQITEG